MNTIPPGNDSLAAVTSLGTAESYGGARVPPWHRPVPPTVLAVVLWASTAAGRWVGPVPGIPSLLTVAAGAALLAARRRLRAVMVCLGAVVLGLAGGAREWGVTQVQPGECGGSARVITDPRAFGSAVTTVLSVDGVRLRATGNGSVGARLSRFPAGSTVDVHGTCAPVRDVRRSRELVNHVTGRMSVDDVSEFAGDGGAPWRAANRVRSLFLRGTRTMGADDAALFAGLVIGDDSRQPGRMIEEFRASGLSHLCSVSGQNVAFVLAAFSPLLRRLRPTSRLAATLGVIAWFVLLTRAEPSVLRASFMAAVVALNFFRGRPMNGRSVLAVSVCALLVIDPVLAFSVGFMLSAGATAGLAWLSHPLEKVLRLPPVVAATLAAQVGTLPVAVLVFGRLPLVSLVANPLAVPVAGAVMLLGIPVALVAGVMPDAVATVAGAVMAVPTRFVAVVAHLCAAVEPGGRWSLVGWCGVVCLLVLRGRRHPSVAG